MRHLLTDLRGNPIFGRHRRAPPQRRYRHPHLPAIFYLIENRQWHQVLKRAKTHPHEICIQEDVNGNTPLHICCRHDPPPEVIKALMAASQIANTEGATPLHVAATHRCSAQALQVLLDGNPFPSNKGPAGTLSPTAVLTRTGRAPIHYACMSFRGLQVEAFRLLLETTLKEGVMLMEDKDDFDEEDEDDETFGRQQREDGDDLDERIKPVVVNVMTLRDATGQTPLGLLFRRYRERVRSVLQTVERLHKEHSKNPHRASLAAALRVQADLGELWEKARYIVARLTEERLQREGEMLFQQETFHSPGEALVVHEAAAWAAEQHTSSAVTWLEPQPETKVDHVPPRPFRIVHASVGLTGYGCPPEMIRLAISVHPHQVREMDEDGNLPLHIAAVASSFCMDTIQTTQPNLSASDDAFETMSMVSDMSFLSCTTMARNKQPFEKVIKLLLQLYPDSVKIPHGRSGRLPLVLALQAGRRTWHDGIKTLLYAYPAALHLPKVVPETLMPDILSKIGQTGESNSSNNTVFEFVLSPPFPPPSSSTMSHSQHQQQQQHHWGLLDFLNRNAPPNPPHVNLRNRLAQQQQQNQQQPQRQQARRRPNSPKANAGLDSQHQYQRGITTLFELIKTKPDLITAALTRSQQRRTLEQSTTATGTSTFNKN